ncbi:MAG: hypothetical protein HUJ31_08225 [Pseudomonadales bacterium]|nr:hypothetical protein [Pseudomonadales bacterium]
MEQQVVIPEKFRGPPTSGNGGYVAGTFASFLTSDGPAEVTLRAPIPLDKPMSVNPAPTGEGEDMIVIQDGDTLIAEVIPAPLALEVPAPPSREKTLEAAPRSPALLERDNPIIPGSRGFHPICFCCGADHEDGLRVFAAPIKDSEQVAAVWQTSEHWGDDQGLLPASWLWTALDCPGQFAWHAAGIVTGMLGRITAEVFRPAPAGEEYLVTAWPIEVEGKKHFAGSAIFDAGGNLVAQAKSVWIGRRNG